ncbi:hypothetical protein BH23CHL5_BH23CHL5_11090 [soil metagenome]
MDQTSRQRARVIRTIGRLSTTNVDDVLLAQWPTTISSSKPQNDVAISSEWPTTITPSLRPVSPGEGLAQEDFLKQCNAYEEHQTRVADRILQSIHDLLDGKQSGPTVHEPPPVSLEALLDEIDRSLPNDRRSAELRTRLAMLAEQVARLSAIAELHRAGLLTVQELRKKSDQIRSIGNKY